MIRYNVKDNHVTVEVTRTDTVTVDVTELLAAYTLHLADALEMDITDEEVGQRFASASEVALDRIASASALLL